MKYKFTLLVISVVIIIVYIVRVVHINSNSISPNTIIYKSGGEVPIEDVNLRMLVNKILIHQNEDKSLDVKFEINGDFNNASIELENQL